MASLLLGSLDLTAGPYEAQVGSSMGSWASITSAVSSLFLDGSVVSGEATANRQITLQVFVNAATQSALTAACEALIGQANQPSNTLTWTPDGGVPIVYEVFRAAGPVQTDAAGEFQLYHIYQLTFPALPFARTQAREMAGATPPAVTIDEMETALNGVVMLETVDQYSPNYGGPNNRNWAAPQGDNLTVATAYVASFPASGWTAVTNCSVTYVANKARVTSTAAGDVEVVSSTIWAFATADALTASLNIAYSAAGIPCMVGIEWMDASTSLRVDWGVPQVPYERTIWAATMRPASATRVRVRLRGLAAVIATYVEIAELLLIPSARSTVGVLSGWPVPHSGVSDLAILPQEPYWSDPVYSTTSGWVHRDLPAPVNMNQPWLTVWIQLLYTGATFTPTDTQNSFSIRLWDATGKWSRFWFTPGYVPATTWFQLGASLTAPFMSSAAGPANLAAITSYDVDFRAFYYIVSQGNHPGWVVVDSLGAGPAPAPGVSPRGGVMTLTDIHGSARTTAAVTLSSALPLTDWLVAAIDGTNGPPLVLVSADVATVAAPAGYDGVHSILGCLAPAVSVTTPTCTIVQQNAGVTVATRVLSGTLRTGMRYVDFGAVELPLVATPPENLGVSYTFTLAPSSASWVEVLVIDVDASLAWVDNLVTALPVGWVDEPDIVAGLGKVWVGTATDRSDARALALPPTMSRPLQVKAPSTRLLIYSTTIAPNVSLTYWPRWLVEPS